MKRRIGKDGLTNQQRRFVREYLKDQNGTQAYIRAGYSYMGAAQSASKLLTNPNIQEAVQKGVARLAELCDITAEKNLRAMAEIAYNRNERTGDRLKAQELIGRSLAQFTDVKKIEADILTDSVSEAEVRLKREKIKNDC